MDVWVWNAWITVICFDGFVGSSSKYHLWGMVDEESSRIGAIRTGREEFYPQLLGTQATPSRDLDIIHFQCAFGGSLGWVCV